FVRSPAAAVTNSGAINTNDMGELPTGRRGHRGIIDAVVRPGSYSSPAQHVYVFQYRHLRNTGRTPKQLLHVSELEHKSRRVP
ncbi:hypothetical protein C7253_19125, partial [Mycobacterium tuberculosis]